MNEWINEFYMCGDMSRNKSRGTVLTLCNWATLVSGKDFTFSDHTATPLNSSRKYLLGSKETVAVQSWFLSVGEDRIYVLSFRKAVSRAGHSS